MFGNKNDFEKDKKENIKDMIKALENEKKSYIVTAFGEGIQCMAGEPAMILTQIVGMIRTLYKDAKVPKESILKSIDLAFKDEEELDKEIKSKLDKINDKLDKEIDKLVDKFLSDILGE